MATPVGHMLVGATVGISVRSRVSLRRRMIIGGLVGAMADLDFLPGLFIGDPARFHHGPSHSLAFAVLLASLAWLAVSDERWKWALWVGFAYASHLLLDFLTVDPSPPVGIPLLWPLSDFYMISPITPFPRVLHSSTTVLNWHNVRVGALEIVLFGTALGAVTKWKGRKQTG